MKKNIFILTVLLLAPLAALAQSVTVDSVSAPTMCDTAQVTVYYSASGTFGAKNVFTVQLSDASGSFSPYFANAGSLKTTGSGAITISIPQGDHYRVRVSSSNPYMVSNDNGRDIKVGASPSAAFYFGRDSAYYNYPGNVTNVLIGDTVNFAAGMAYDSSNLSFSWNFGVDASPQTSSAPSVKVVYSTTGLKKASLAVSNKDGCTKRDTQIAVGVLGCGVAVPADAIIDSTNLSPTGYVRGSYWVVPGGSLTLPGVSACSVFAEPGSTVKTFSSHDTIYLKPGAVCDNTMGNSIVIYSPGASIMNKTSTLECPLLGFDYSNAPPYKITWAQAGVAPERSAASTTRVYPDPATRLIHIEAAETPRSLIVRNELGATVLTDNAPLTRNFEFDVLQLPAGTYFAELVTNAGREVTKFTVQH